MRAAYRVPALFAGSVHAVETDEAPLVFEHQRRNLEWDPTMLALVSQILPLIPLVAHAVYTQCSTI